MSNILKYGEWKAISPKENIKADVSKSFEKMLDTCGWTDYIYTTNVGDKMYNYWINQKATLNTRLGSCELYNICTHSSTQIDDDTLSKIAERYAKLTYYVYKYMVENVIDMDSIIDCMNSMDNIIKMIIKKEDANYDMLKSNFNEFEYVSKLRHPLPKMTKIISNMLTLILDKYTPYIDKTVTNKLITEIVSTMGSTKPKQYIVVLSTTPSAIYTSSVSDYFYSCYKIYSHNLGMYASSTGYLTMDTHVAVVKIFEMTEQNKELLENGGIGALSSSNKALARRLVFFNDNTDKTSSYVICGKAYPNADLLDCNDLLTSIYPLWSKNTDNNVVIQDLRELSTKPVKYSNLFKGYPDLTSANSGSIIYNNNTLDTFETMTIGQSGIFNFSCGILFPSAKDRQNIGFFKSKNEYTIMDEG